ncbi:hypothetical protein N7465_010682 [Penicillium sp. CMV-2018d]|nr:hypothetical protein N7465_010682 [Penicillium sp. CMV-2018d]
MILFDNDHEDVLDRTGILATAYWLEGCWEEAEELQVQVVETRKTKLGEFSAHIIWISFEFTFPACFVFRQLIVVHLMISSPSSGFAELELSFFVIDYVPGYSDSLFICTGGSGHGFKFLPVLGKYVKNQLEKVPDRFTPIWKWRTVGKGKDCNGLEEGEAGPREMSKLKMAKPSDFQFTSKSGLALSSSPSQMNLRQEKSHL